MIGWQVDKVDIKTERIEKPVKKTAFENFRHAAASIAKYAKSLIKKRGKSGPGPVGGPPKTSAKRGQNLRGAIRYHAGKEDAVAGPVASLVDEAGAAHEHGETYKGDEFDERPFMAPSLEANLARIHADWDGAVGG